MEPPLLCLLSWQLAEQLPLPVTAGVFPLLHPLQEVQPVQAVAVMVVEPPHARVRLDPTGPEASLSVRPGGQFATVIVTVLEAVAPDPSVVVTTSTWSPLDRPEGVKAGIR